LVSIALKAGGKREQFLTRNAPSGLTI